MPIRFAAPRKTIFTAVALLCVSVFALMESDYLRAQTEYQLRDKNAVQAPAPVTATPDRLWIAAIGLKEVPIIDVTERKEAAYQAAVKQGVGHFPGTAAIGQPGNAYLFGHSSDYVWADGDYKTVFALLPKLNVGDEIVVSDHAGLAYRYVVTETKVVPPGDLSVLDQGGDEKYLLTLQTSYPLGTALKRYIVRAEMVMP